MRLLYGRSHLMFGFAVASCLSLGCSERNNVARGGEAGAPGTSGSSSGGTVSGDSGSSSSAGSNATEGGDAAGGSAGVSGAGTSDAGETGAAVAGAGGEGSTNDRKPALVLAGMGSDGPQGLIYVDGVWAPAVPPVESPWGIALTTLADGTALAAATRVGFRTSRWDGKWAASVAPVPGLEAPAERHTLSRMVAFPDGALVTHSRGEGALVGMGQDLRLNTFHAASQRWTLEEDLGVEGGVHSSVSYTGDGDPLVVYFANGVYWWVHKTNGSWGEPAELETTGEVYVDPNPMPLGDGVWAEADLVRRPGADEVVGVFANEQHGLDYSVFSNGAWSPAVRIAADATLLTLGGDGPFSQLTRHTSFVALPDGRLALAYWAGKNVKIGFLDGSTWSEFKVVPETVVQSYAPIAIAPGAPGAELELLYVRKAEEPPPSVGDACPGLYCLLHLRLASEAEWIWTPAKQLDDNSWWSIAVTAVP